MITHGNKQISEIVYARKSSEGGGAVRLTNIIRGAQVVFGGLYPKVTWLYPPTRAAILAAFGQMDGKAVINATNAYLNALAATDPTKASALAVFINEDLAPWMNAYCSEYLDWVYDLMPWIGTEVWIRNANSSYFRTGISKDLNDQLVEKTYCKYTIGGVRRLTGLSPNKNGYWGVTRGNTFEMHTEVANDTTQVTSNPITQKNFALKDYIIGKDNGELQLFALEGSYSGSGILRLDSQVYKNGVLVRWYVPFIRSGVVGYLNLLDGTMATKRGNFTIEKVTDVAAWDILSQMPAQPTITP